MNSLPRTLRLAVLFSLREMRGGLSGFFVFIACIALGVARNRRRRLGGERHHRRGLSQGQALLGGDLRFELVHREAAPQERAFLDSLGQVAESATTASMARLPDGSDQALVEAKAVDPNYPLYGTLQTEPALSRDALFGERDGVWGAAAADLLFARLGLKLGDRIMLGDKTFELRARIVNEPDAIAGGFAFAPRLMVSLAGPARHRA